MNGPVEGLPAPRRVLPVLVLAQLAGTSTWFAVNAVMPALQAEFGWDASAVGTLTSAVQLGFISGALVLALLSVADRFSARRVFLFASIAQALCTLIAVAVAESFTALCVWRFLTGFLLAGIYPVGMKIAAQWFPRGLGHAAGHGHDLGDLAGFLQARGFFHRDLVERVHRHLDVGDIDAAAVGLDADLDVVVDHAFDGYQDFHSVPLKNG